MIGGMKRMLQALLEVGIVAAMVAIVWADPAPVTEWLGADERDEQLLCSAWCSDDERFEDALARGASVGASDYSGSTPLHYAAMSGNVHLVRRLIEMGAEVDAENEGKLTPLMNAVANDHADVVEILLREGAAATDDVLDLATRTGSVRAQAELRRQRRAAAAAAAETEEP